jgi:hypothetical protein
MVLWMAAQVRPPRAVSPTFVTTTSGGIIYLNTKNEPIPRVQQAVRVALSASRTLSLSEMKVEAVPDTALMDLLNRVDVHDYRPSVIDSPGPGYREQAGILPP